MFNKIKYYLYIVAYYLKHPAQFTSKIRSEFLAQRIKIDRYTGNKKVSILIVVYNAPDYVKQCLVSLSKTAYKNYEIIVVDNNSLNETKNYLIDLEKSGNIKLHVSTANNYFSKGNNLAAAMSDPNSDYYLLLNSDTEIINPYWLDILLNNVESEGIISFGKTDIPVVRPDGWCYLISKKMYTEAGGINEFYQMNWGITELTSKVARSNHVVKTIINPDGFVKHYGQKSHSSTVNSSKFNKMSMGKVRELYDGVKIELLKIENV